MPKNLICEIFFFEETRTSREATINTPYVNLFEVGTERDSFAGGIDCIDVFVHRATLFPRLSHAILFNHKIMFALDAVAVNEKGTIIIGDGVVRHCGISI